MAGKTSFVWLALALAVAALALWWPAIEQQLAAKGGACPWPFSLFHAPKEPEVAPAPPSDEPRVYTVEELKQFDGTDKERPILLAIGGKVVDVSAGEKFYGPGKMYHQFAGTACTRALTLSSLDKKDISDDISDFTEEKLKEMEETKQFYYDKYPVVGVLATDN